MEIWTMYIGVLDKTTVEYYERQLEIAKEVADMEGKGEGQGNLSKDYRCSGQFKTATEYHQRQLEIA